MRTKTVEEGQEPGAPRIHSALRLHGDDDDVQWWAEGRTSSLGRPVPLPQQQQAYGGMVDNPSRSIRAVMAAVAGGEPEDGTDVAVGVDGVDGAESVCDAREAVGVNAGRIEIESIIRGVAPSTLPSLRAVRMYRDR